MFGLELRYCRHQWCAVVLGLGLAAGSLTGNRHIERVRPMMSPQIGQAAIEPREPIRVDSATGAQPADQSELPIGDGTVPAGMPVSGIVTSPYTAARWHPILHLILPHHGVDIAAHEGDAVRVTAAGVVRAIAMTPTYGRVLDVDHLNGYVTRYAHNAAILVRVGEWVQRGDAIALVGASGRATGPHSHYEVYWDGWSIDPTPFLGYEVGLLPASAGAIGAE